MTNHDMRQRAFQRLLEREAGTGADAPAIAAAARRMGERFTQQLTPLIGDAGVAAICDRAIHLTRRQVPELAPLEGPLTGDPPFARLQVSLAQVTPTTGRAAAVAVLAEASTLLASFIGEGLTTSLLREAWPDIFTGDTPEATNT